MNRFALSILLLIPLLTGCGNGMAVVRGTVTLDDQPVKSGSVTFISLEGPLVREGAVISGGSFQASVPPGKYKVELHAQHVIGARTQKGFDGKDEELPLTEELFSDRYNTNSDLTEVITAGENVITLKLKK